MVTLSKGDALVSQFPRCLGDPEVRQPWPSQGTCLFHLLRCIPNQYHPNVLLTLIVILEVLQSLLGVVCDVRLDQLVEHRMVPLVSVWALIICQSHHFSKERLGQGHP